MAGVAARSTAAKKLSTSINIKPLTSLQKLMISSEFDGFIIAVILLNCILMASESPVLESQATYIIIANYFFNVVFILELVSQIVAFGILPYFSDYWHWLDALVVSTSVLDIIVAILALLQNLIHGGITFTINTKVLRVLRVVRFLRVLRPLKALRYFKGILVFVESLALSADILLITTGMFFTSMIAIAFLTNSFIGDLLLNRCLPQTTYYNGTLDIFLNSSARADPNYITYGVNYFTSSYNLDYCRDSSNCRIGVECLRAPGYPFDGVPGDYSTPWHAFKSNLGFITLRGWPLIFSAIAKGYSKVYAFLVLISTMLICPLFILNMFPAIFIISLKKCEDAQLRLDWLAHFPGDKETVTELELFIWASSNQSLFFRLENAPSVNIITQCLSCVFYCFTRCGLLSVKVPKKKKEETVARREIDDDDDDEEEDVFLGNEEDNPDFGKGKLCVPKGRSMAALRSLLTAETSPFSQFINVIIVLNILTLGVDASSTPTSGRLVVLYLNYAFITIFMLEVVVKISLLGPCLYLDNPFNLLDFSLVLLSIPTFISTSFQVIGALRILRLARLAKLAQTTRLYNQLNAEGGPAAALKIRIDLGRLSGMLFDLTSPMINNIILVLILMYIYALIGMQFFASAHAPSYDLPKFSLESRLPYGSLGNATAVDIGSIFSAGEYLPRMNFNCFGNAFVTVFNIGVLNGWYIFMTNSIRIKGQEGALWYFFSYVYFVVFLLGSTLIASVASVMDRHAKAMVRDIASANKSLVDRYACLSRRETLRQYFKVFKRNTIEVDATSSREVNSTMKLKREAVLDGFEDALVEPILTRLRRERSDHSFYIFSRSNPIRRLIKLIVESVLFQLLVTFAVIISVIGVIAIGSQDVIGPNESIFIVIIFFSEMGALWLAYGLFGATDAYFNQPLYLVDFFVNIAMVYAYYSNIDTLNQLRLFRMLKLPNLMLYVTDSNTLRLFFDMLYEAIPSIGSVVNLSLGLIFLSAVVGVQLYTGAFSHCSNVQYPGGAWRYAESATHYPTGCSGTGYDNTNVSHSHAVFNNVTGYGVGTIIYNQHWKPRLDNFDSIFTACKSTLRVIMSNEWQGIIFSALDLVGVDYNPKTNYHRAAGGGNFIFLFILSLMGVTLGALYVAVFYYHYVITCILTGRKRIIGRQDAMWALYEEKLILARPTTAAAGSKWALLARFYHRTDVKFLIVAYCIIPLILLIGYYGNPAYTDLDFIFYDTIFSLMYVVEYTVRGMSDFTLKRGFGAVYKSTNKQEALVVMLLCAFIYINGQALSGDTRIVFNAGKSRDLEFVCASGILRVYRLAILFPNALRVLGVMQTSLGGFLSLCVYGTILVLIYGLLGFDLMRNLNPTYGSPFLDDTLNFNSLFSSFFTLLAVGTGNYYSEILDNMKQETENFGLQVFIEIYFLSFVFLFFLALKSFAIQIIIRYESSFGASLGIAGEQVSGFQHAWRKAGLFDKVKYDKLPSLFSKYLPPPLGLAGTDVKYHELSRFIKKVLLCMPADAKRSDDLDKSGRYTRVLFPPETVPSDIRNTNESWEPSKHRFSFRQVIIAVHKRALFDLVLADEAATNAKREIHKSRLDAIVVYLGRLTLQKYDLQQMPFKSMILMQRIKPDIYRSAFVSIMRAQLHTLRLKIHVFGFSAFDAFIVTTLRDAVNLEKKASELQLEVKKSLEVAAHHSRKSMEALDTAKKYQSNVKGLSKVVDDLYDTNMETLWDVSTLDVFANGREKRAVTAVAIDSSGKVYVALNSGLLKIYKTRDTPGLPLRLVQKVIISARIRSLVVSADAKKIFVGCGDKVTVLVLASNRKRLNYKELLSFSGHSAAVNAVLPFGRFILSAGQDSLVYLWRLNSKEPANSYDAGSPVFCMCVMPIHEANVAVDETTLTDILICGTQRGRLLVLPLPLLSSSNESATWDAYYVEAGECGVSSVSIAWGYVYAGFTDGRVKTWAVEMVKNENTIAKPIKMVNFLPVQSVQVHAGPVTCLAHTGGTLFSASYDFSILPWTAPDRRNAKTSGNFTQSYKQGLIYHSNCILSISHNKHFIVTGDEGGRVVVLGPKKVREDFMSSGGDSGSNTNSKPLFNFSFIEYDFKKCFLDNNGGVIEEEVILTVQNLSGVAATIRCLLKRHPSFRVEVCENENRNAGCQVVALTSPGSTSSKIATLFDNLHTVQFRIIFHPIEVRVVHLPIQFLVNEKDMVSIQLRGSGCKSKLYMGNTKLYEMGTTAIGGIGTQHINIENREDRPILMNCLAECEDKKENTNYEIITVKYNLAAKYISVIPRCQLIPPHTVVEVIVRFNPPVKMDVFKIPVRAIYGGGEGTLAEIRVRSADPPGSVTRDTMAAPGRKQSLSVQSGQSGQSGQGQSGQVGQSGQTSHSISSISQTREKDLVKNHRLGSMSGEEKEIEDAELQLGLFDEVKALQYLYRGLRPLSPSETPCPSDLLTELLQDIGWNIAIEGQLVLLMHAENGVFIEIPNCHSSSSTAASGRPEALPTVNEFQIDFMCDEPCFYELWYGDRLICDGPAEQDTLHDITIDASELYHVTDRFGSAVPIPMPFTTEKDVKNIADRFQSATSGSQTLALMIYSRDPTEKVKNDLKKVDRKPLCSNVSVQPDGRMLLHVTYIKIRKGFRLGMLPTEDSEGEDDHGTLQLEERVSITGIMRVVTYMDDDLGTLTEIFEQEIVSNSKAQGAVLHKKNEVINGDSVEELFSRAILSINTSLQSKQDIIPEKSKNNLSSPKSLDNWEDNGPTHVKVTDKAVALEIQDQLESAVVEHKSEVTEAAKSISGIKNVHLEKPVLTGDINIHRCSREIAIELIKKPVSDGGDDMVKDVTLAHVTVAGHAAMRMKSEQQVFPFAITHSTLPHLIHSHRHGVYLKVIKPKPEPISRMKQLNSMMNQIAQNQVPTLTHVGSLFEGQYYFLVDRNSLKLVSSALMDPVETVDITFLTRGFVAEFRPAEKCMAVMDGRHVTSNGVDELPKTMKAVLSKLQLANNQGMSSQFTDAPMFMRSKWGEFVKHSLHRKVVNAMFSVVERSRIIAQGRAAQEAAMIIKEYESAAASAASSTAGSKVARKGADGAKKKEAEDKAKAILDAVPPTIDLTFRDIYADMTRITNEFALNSLNDEKNNKKMMKDEESKAARKDSKGQKQLAASVMNIRNLSAFLLNETLSGFDEPLSNIQCGVVLEALERNYQTFAVKIEQFAVWYRLDDEKLLKAELRPKRVFANILEEIQHGDEQLEGGDSNDKIIKGSAAKKMINDCHLGLSEYKKWEKQEKELQRSSSYMDAHENYLLEPHKTSASIPSDTLRHIQFLPSMKGKNPIKSLTGFMKKMSLRRTDKMSGKDKSGDTRDSKDIRDTRDTFDDKSAKDSMGLSAITGAHRNDSEDDDDDDEYEDETKIGDIGLGMYPSESAKQRSSKLASQGRGQNKLVEVIFGTETDSRNRAGGGPGGGQGKGKGGKGGDGREGEEGEDSDDNEDGGDDDDDDSFGDFSEASDGSVDENEEYRGDSDGEGEGSDSGSASSIDDNEEDGDDDDCDDWEEDNRETVIARGDSHSHDYDGSNGSNGSHDSASEWNGSDTMDTVPEPSSESPEARGRNRPSFSL